VRGLTIPLLSDFHPKGDVARRYQVWRDGDGFSERALYVIDPQGRIAYSHVSPYLHHVPDIYDLLTAVDKAVDKAVADPADPGEAPNTSAAGMASAVV
jgi:peroxiredoxin